MKESRKFWNDSRKADERRRPSCESLRLNESRGPVSEYVESLRRTRFPKRSMA